MRDTHTQAVSGHSRLLNILALVFVLLAFAGVCLRSPYALVTVVLDGLAVAVVLLPAMLAGSWLVPVFGCGKMPLRWHFLLGATLGLGAMSVLVLLLGLAGLLQRSVWVALLAVAAGAGVVRWWALLKRCRANAGDRQTAGPAGAAGIWSFLWLPAIPFAVLALLAASTAPGFIWAEEGFGYDVLEYHLQLPKEYFQAGRIEYVPHNVYANFPANVEMLYLLAMIVLDDVEDVGVVANMIHLTLAVLTVFAAWVTGREWSKRAGVVCGVVMATTGWLAYLSGLAYVENGVLLFGTVSAAVVLRLARCDRRHRDDAAGAEGNATPQGWRTVVLAGVLAGLACGCKYTAIPLVAVPLGLATLLAPRWSARRRLIGGSLFTVATLITLCPWLIKNQAMTGNPVFPLANTVFQASPPGWGVEETERWDRGHRAQAHERTTGARFTAMCDHVLWDKYQRFGPVIFLLAVGGLLGRRRDRVDSTLLVILVVQVAVWLLMTHLFARFAVVLLIPLALLAGRSVLAPGSVVRRGIIAAVLVAGCAWNLTFAMRLHAQEGAGGAPASMIYRGQLAGFEYFHTVNYELSPDAKVLLVGDAKAFYFQRQVDYCVAFNRNPFLERIASADTEQEIVGWLRERGYTHVLVNWSEVRRLALTYGLSPSVDPQQLEAWFDRLSAVGLAQIRVYSHSETQGRYIELYELGR